MVSLHSRLETTGELNAMTGRGKTFLSIEELDAPRPGAETGKNERDKP